MQHPVGEAEPGASLASPCHFELVPGKQMSLPGCHSPSVSLANGCSSAQQSSWPGLAAVPCAALTCPALLTGEVCSRAPSSMGTSLVPGAVLFLVASVPQVLGGGEPAPGFVSLQGLQESGAVLLAWMQVCCRGVAGGEQGASPPRAASSSRAPQRCLAGPHTCPRAGTFSYPLALGLEEVLRAELCRGTGQARGGFSSLGSRTEQGAGLGQGRAQGGGRGQRAGRCMPGREGKAERQVHGRQGQGSRRAGERQVEEGPRARRGRGRGRAGVCPAGQGGGCQSPWHRLPPRQRRLWAPAPGSPGTGKCPLCPWCPVLPSWQGDAG